MGIITTNIFTHLYKNMDGTTLLTKYCIATLKKKMLVKLKKAD